MKYSLTFYLRGNWRDIQYCKEDMAVCGIQVRMAVASTALNGAKFYCCPLPRSSISSDISASNSTTSISPPVTTES